MSETTGGATRDTNDEQAVDEPPLSDSMHDHFFSEGDEGRYEGGPATFEEQSEHLAALEADVLEEKRKSSIRTPEQEARRAKFVRLVVRVVGSCVAVLLVAMVWARIRSDRDQPYAPPVPTIPAPEVEVPKAETTEQRPPNVVVPAPEQTEPPAAPEPEATEAAAVEQPAPEQSPVAQEPEPSPAPAKTEPAPAAVTPKPTRPRPAPAPVRAERPRPRPEPPPVVAPPPPAGDNPPTAAFPVQ